MKVLLGLLILGGLGAAIYFGVRKTGAKFHQGQHIIYQGTLYLVTGIETGENTGILYYVLQNTNTGYAYFYAVSEVDKYAYLAG